MFFIALFWTGIILYFCLVDSKDIPAIQIANLDKYVHTFFHFVFTFIWFLFFKKQLQCNNTIKPLVYSFLFSFVFGICIEFLQEIVTTTRHGDVLDVLANLTGATLAFFTVVICDKLNLFNSVLKN